MYKGALDTVDSLKRTFFKIQFIIRILVVITSDHTIHQAPRALARCGDLGWYHSVESGAVCASLALATITGLD